MDSFRQTDMAATSMSATIIPLAYTKAIRDCVEDSATQY